MKFIGLRLCEHDSNISYSDGRFVKYYKSERDYQIKHHGFQDLSQWKKIIDAWNINPSEIDAIGIVIDCFRHPYLKCDESKIYEVIDMPLFKLMGFDCPVFRINHHYVHTLSTWTLGINPTVGFVFDGFGDDFISHSIFRNSEKILEYSHNDYPSFGMILGEIGYHMGLSGHGLDCAGKIMALKGYGSSKELNRCYDLKTLADLWDIDYLISLFDSDGNEQKINDHIKTCHQETERIYVEHFLKHSTEDDVIAYSGGVAQNTVINSEIKKLRPNLHIPPHCTDEGLSLGVLEFFRQYYEQESFDTSGYPYWQSDQAPDSIVSEKTISKTAELLAQGKIVGWYQGNGEVGSRALGNRSILMDPSIANGKEILNDRVKHREWFRPFGASVLEEETQKYFDWEGDSPHMLYVMDILDKNSFPAITHIDGTCRIQTVSSNLGSYYELIDKFKDLTGIPMLLNTSLNNGGKPICGTKNDAFELFTTTDLDVLVIGDSLYEK